jgi:Holliday junction resolvasome RuvABC endonuclease subunit
MSIIQPVDANRIVLEGYSFGSTGRVFHIAENIGLLKHKMWEAKIKFDVIAPTAIKKFATGKGNANKEKMQEAFVDETNIDVKLVLSQSEKQWSPSGDIIDSYYMCKYAFDLATTGELP